MTKLRFFLFCILLFSFSGFAGVPAWKIIPEKSHLTFNATQNNSPVVGEFKTFSADINFDRNQLEKSKITIIIDMGSVSASYGQVADTLKTPDWFNIKLFPQAKFTSSSFKKMGDNLYQAEGALTIRDKTIPVSLQFSLDESASNTTAAKGFANIKRTQYGVGQGEWAATDLVKDEVKVEFLITAMRQ